MNLLKTLVVVTAILMMAAPYTHAQVMLRRDANQPDMTIDVKARATLIESTLKAMQEAYVLPEGATRTETAIRQKVAAGTYNTITSAKTLAETLTRDLQEATRDKHLRLLYSHAALPEIPAIPSPPSPAMREEFRRQGARFNYGFRRIEQLEGNVGYLDIAAFVPPEIGGDKAAAAMAFLADTEALIIDLRNCRGGAPEMVAFLSTYFFEGEAVHLNDIHDRPRNETRQFWTLPHVPGRRYTNKSIYILTDKTTFSAGEEFAYNLQALKRATIIGEITGGGAHPTGPRRLSEHFVLLLPTARSVNPITKTNWEGVGIKPDMPVAASQALATAHQMALKNLLAKATNEHDKTTLREALSQREQAEDKARR